MLKRISRNRSNGSALPPKRLRNLQVADLSAVHELQRRKHQHRQEFFFVALAAFLENAELSEISSRNSALFYGIHTRFLELLQWDLWKAIQGLKTFLHCTSKLVFWKIVKKYDKIFSINIFPKKAALNSMRPTFLPLEIQSNRARTA